MPRNPYVQVALTYVRRPLASWQNLNCMIGVVCAFIMGCWEPRSPILLVALLCASIYVITHAAQQFANQRSHLMPNFRRVHIIVGGIMAFALTVILPAIVIFAAGMRSIGLIAFAVCFFGVVLCQTVYSPGWIGSLMGMASVVFWTPWGIDFIRQFVSGQFEFQALGMLVAGGVLTVLGGIRLFLIEEDMPRYYTLSAIGTNRMTTPRPAEGMRLPGGLSAWIAERQIARVIRHARCVSGSLWSSVCRWQLGMIVGWSALTSAFFVCLYIPIMLWIIGQNICDGTALFMIAMCAYIPQGFVWGAIWRRTPMLQRELLLPVDRPTYIGNWAWPPSSANSNSGWP